MLGHAGWPNPPPPVPAAPLPVLPPVPAIPPVPPPTPPIPVKIGLQPAPSAQGHAVSLAQLHVRSPAALGAWQTHHPILAAPPESKY